MCAAYLPHFRSETASQFVNDNTWLKTCTMGAPQISLTLRGIIRGHQQARRSPDRDTCPHEPDFSHQKKKIPHKQEAPERGIATLARHTTPGRRQPAHTGVAKISTRNPKSMTATRRGECVVVHTCMGNSEGPPHPRSISLDLSTKSSRASRCVGRGTNTCLTTIMRRVSAWAPKNS